MILYHGSNVDFQQIELEKSKTNKDFGKGFYLSDSREQAEKLAQFKVVTLGGNVIIHRFEIEDDILTRPELSIKIFKEYSREWAEFIFLNRKNDTDIQKHEYDIVFGPIANDKVGMQIRKLQDGSIDFEEFLHRIKYMKGITFQYFFGTQRAIDKLKKL